MVPYDRLNKKDFALKQLLDWFKAGRFFCNKTEKIEFILTGK